jgi:hypothetical protein
MGNLKPGATYIYEHADGITYAREFNADPSTRVAIGWDYEVQKKAEITAQTILWEQIYLAAKTNPALQEAIDRVIVLYQLSKL